MDAIRRPKDLLAGLLFLAIGVGAMLIAQDYPMGTARSMGPGAFPVALGGLLALFGAVLSGRAFVGERQEGPDFAPWPLAVVLSGLLIFAMLLFGAGLFIAVFVLVAIAGLAGGELRPRRTLVLGLLLALACTGLFVYGLGQRLPVFGPWLGWF